MDIHPNSHKVVLFYSAVILGIALGIGWGIIALSQFIDVEFLIETFASLGIIIETPSLTMPMIGIAVLAVFLVLFVSYGKSHTVYEFAQDRLVHRKNFLIISLGEDDFPYNNISRVSFEDKILKTGNVILDFTGLKINRFTMKFIDNPQETAATIQTLINTYKAQYYAQYNQQYQQDQAFTKYI
jgi:hypothetical protein